MKNTIVGVDLAKDVIQVCVYTNKKVRSNIEMTPSEFIEFLANSTSLTIVFEACGTSNYWKQKAISLGHDARLISAKLVSAVRPEDTSARSLINQCLMPLKKGEMNSETLVTKYISSGNKNAKNQYYYRG